MTDIVPQSNFTFQKATKSKIKARVAIDGPSGSGKTYTAIIAATALSQGGKIAVIDTERGSASLYSDLFNFDVLELEVFSPQIYTQAIEAAEKAGYAVIVIDSLSHAWEGEGGALDMVDDAAARSRSGNSYTAWRDVTPLHRRMIDTILQSKAHIIATMRSKTEYILETNAKGQQVPRKVGMAPIQRAGMEYEFTVVGDMDLDHKIVISKSRFAPLQDKVATKPTVDFFKPFVDWLDSGVDSKPTPITASQPNPDPLEEYLVGEIVTKPKAKAKAKTNNAPELPVLTIEEAYSVTNSQGLKYGETSVKVLEKMLSAMWKQVHDNGLEPDEKAVVLRKISAAKTVMEAKQDGSIQ